MKTRISPLAAIVVALGLAGPAVAQAACYADYKAKQGNPLRLHYGVVAVADEQCDDKAAIAGTLTQRLANDGWTLLNILSIFGPEGLDQRKDSAGQYFLRY